jgi:hypothetical protein
MITLNSTAFWDITLCNLKKYANILNEHTASGSACCLLIAGYLLQLLFMLEDGRCMFLYNISELLLDYMALYF